jgi:hypothetical protein
MTPELQALIIDESEQRRRIAELIYMFEDRDRVEILVEYQGGVIPCSFWRGVWPDSQTGADLRTVALCLDLQLPGMAQKLNERDDPWAIGLDAILKVTGTEVCLDFRGEDTLSVALIFDMLNAAGREMLDPP